MNKCMLIGGLVLFCSCQPSKKGSESRMDSLNKMQDSSVKSSETPFNNTELTAQDTLFDDGSIPTSWRTAGFSRPDDFKRFIIQLKGWVKNNEVDSIAFHVQYPLGEIKNADEFRKQYNALFDGPLKKVIEEQRLDRIFRNYQGAMIGNGAIWFIEKDRNYYISAINNLPAESKKD
ncbi:hypothetical protein [Solitalea lacus]|uniref:hypothetical protein n=1 Tax=Solitalea lacus TaxID=2911172 RepID=UPI001EDA4C9B|nr:hypothetical protein [Solitalea lacus]UKJ08102.1 hypothetical protein L2B55_02790 [Solitalea lacus]